MGHVSHRSANENSARVNQLEVEKKELKMKLKIAREATSEYVTCLNDEISAKNVLGLVEETGLSTYFMSLKLRFSATSGVKG